MTIDLFTNDYFMKEALKEAKKGLEKDEVPIGAVVVSNNKVIARGHNLTEQLNDPTAHAEMQAITAATEYLGGKYLDDCTIYITLEPCIMCAGASYWAQLQKVVYGAKDEKKGFQKTGMNILHPKTLLLGGIMEKECVELIREFFKKKRRENKD